MRKKKVSWTDEELEQVAREAVKLHLVDTEQAWIYIKQAQKNVLTHDRQRVIVGRANINERLIELFCEVRSEILETGVPFPVQIEGPEVPVEPSREELLETITTEELLVMAAKRLTPIIGLASKLMQKSLERPVAVATPPQGNGGQLRSPPTAPTVRKTRVLMYGFIASQERDIREKASGFNLDLIFKKKEGRTDDPPPSCEWCVVINKISHPAWDKMKRKFTSERIRLVEGTSEALKVLADINAVVNSSR